MADPRGFMKHGREDAPYRPVEERLADAREVEGALSPEALRTQASRCMDCGVPFCHGGCPLGNLIPEWNDLVWRDDLDAALDRLHATNNFPEVTGRVCPAPCEQACVLNIDDAPVNIKHIERRIADHGLTDGWTPKVAPRRTGRRIAVVGSGPAGLACAQQLARAGHDVVVYERADRIGGLLRYGIPDFKLDKGLLDARVTQMQAEGVAFRTGVEVGVDVDADALRAEFDAVVLAGGSTTPRDLPIPGRELDGVHFAMDFLTQHNKVVAGDTVPDRISAEGRHVVVIGGGDTGSDCVGTSLRQGAASVTQLEIMPRPPVERTPEMPWPWWPRIFRVSSSHQEGGERDFAVRTVRFAGSGRVERLEGVRVAWEGRDMTDIPGSELSMPADLVLLAMGFTGPESPLLDSFGVERTPRGNAAAEAFATGVSGVFACGDMRRGQSLVVWAIHEGREAARAVDLWLERRTRLPGMPEGLQAAP